MNGVTRRIMLPTPGNLPPAVPVQVPVQVNVSQPIADLSQAGKEFCFKLNLFSHKITFENDSGD